MATAALETLTARLRGGSGAYAITLQTCGERLLLKIVQTSKTSFPELLAIPISRHTAELFLQLPSPTGRQPLPYRRHQAHTAHCWTPWRSPAPVRPGRATNTHLEPAPCTDWRPGTPQSGPGCRDHLEEKRPVKNPTGEWFARCNAERHHSKSDTKHGGTKTGEIKWDVLLGKNPL